MRVHYSCRNTRQPIGKNPMDNIKTWMEYISVFYLTPCTFIWRVNMIVVDEILKMPHAEQKRTPQIVPAPRKSTEPIFFFLAQFHLTWRFHWAAGTADLLKNNDNIFFSFFLLVRPSLQSCDVSAYQAIFSLLVSSYGWLHKHWCREEDVSEIDKGCVECCPRCRFKSKTSMPIMRHQTKISSLAHTQNCVCVCVIALDSGGGKNLANNSYLRWTYIRW